MWRPPTVMLVPPSQSPQAQAGLHDRAVGMHPSQHGIGGLAVFTAHRRFADDVAAETAEVGGSGDRPAIGVGDDGGHTGGVGKSVLQLLDLGQIEEILEAHCRSVYPVNELFLRECRQTHLCNPVYIASLPIPALIRPILAVCAGWGCNTALYGYEEVVRHTVPHGWKHIRTLDYRDGVLPDRCRTANLDMRQECAALLSESRLRPSQSGRSRIHAGR